MASFDPGEALTGRARLLEQRSSAALKPLVVRFRSCCAR